MYSQLLLHWIVTVIVLVAPPAGPAYNFIVDLYVYTPFPSSIPHSSTLPQTTNKRLFKQLHLPRRLDKHFRSRRPPLPTLRPQRKLDLALPRLAPRHRPIRRLQRVLGHRPLHPAHRRLGRGGVPVLRVSCGRGGCFVAGLCVLDCVDQGLACDRRV